MWGLQVMSATASEWVTVRCGRCGWAAEVADHGAYVTVRCDQYGRCVDHQIGNRPHA